MKMQDCIFCKILNKGIPSEIVYEDADFVVIKDVKPFGPIALLVIPKEHIETIIDLEGRGGKLADLFAIGIKMVKEFGLDTKGFSFHINGGGLQEVSHLHLKIGGAWENSEAEGYPKW